MIAIALTGLVSAVFIALMCVVAGQGRVTSIPADDDEPSDYGHVEPRTAPRRIATRPSEMPLRRQP